MKLPSAFYVWLVGTFAVPGAATAAVPAPAAPATPAAPVAERPDDRLIFSVQGSSLEAASDGGGGAVRWLHNVNAGTLVGAGVDYQTIAGSHWTYASLSGSVTLGERADARWTFYGEIQQGSGRGDGGSFDYSVFSGGVFRTLTSRLTLQLDDQQIDIDTTHGNLPKLGLSYLWNPQLLTSISYMHSVSGNLGTELGSARIDYFGKALNFLAGAAYGQASPAVLDLQTGAVFPGSDLKEVFVGFSKPFSRGEWMLIADYLDLEGIERVTLTLNFTIHLRARNQPR